MKISPNAPCPCGRRLKYKKCCGSLHRGQPAATPEDLMRSRYTAYALKNVAHIMKTTHPLSPHYQADASAWAAQLKIFCDTTRFEKLEVLSTQKGNSPDEGYVTYRATMFQGERNISSTERSLFRKLQGRWLYVKGE